MKTYANFTAAAGLYRVIIWTADGSAEAGDFASYDDAVAKADSLQSETVSSAVFLSGRRVYSRGQREDFTRTIAVTRIAGLSDDGPATRKGTYTRR